MKQLLTRAQKVLWRPVSHAAGLIAVVLFGVGLVVAGARAEIRTPRIITQTQGSSDCIGNPETAVCALETWIACLNRADPQLCAAVGLKGIRFPDSGFGNYYIYRTLHVKKLSQSDITRLATVFPWSKVDDTEIEYAGQACRLTERFCFDQPAGRHSVFVRRQGRAWTVMGWVHETGDVVCEHYISGSKNAFDRECELMIPERLYLEYFRVVRKNGERVDRGLFRIDPTPLLREHAP